NTRSIAPASIAIPAPTLFCILTLFFALVRDFDVLVVENTHNVGHVARVVRIEPLIGAVVTHLGACDRHAPAESSGLTLRVEKAPVRPVRTQADGKCRARIERWQ